MTGPILSTERLLLRVPQQQDLDAWADMLGDERARFVGGPMTRSEAWRSMSSMTGHWCLRGFGMFSVIEAATGDCIGRAGAWMPEGWPGAEIGWALRRDYEGRGLATEASGAAIRWVFEDLGWDRVIHCIHPGNIRSKATAARLGSRFLEMVRLPKPLDRDEIEIHGQSREEWRAGSATR